jgi:subtilisin family serine protease
MKTLARLGVSAGITLALATSVAMAERPDGSGDGRYMVKFRDFQGAAGIVRAAGGEVALELVPQGVIAAYLPAQALEALQKNPNVESVEVDARRYPMAQTKPWGIAMVQADDAAFAVSDASVASMVCIIDSGYSLAHEDLSGNNVSGTDVSGTGNWSEDTCGHGSHVAGTVAAVNNSLGVVGVNGNGTLKLHVIKVFDGADCGWAYSSSLVGALNECRKANLTDKKLVVSMSLGGSRSSSTENTAFQTAYNDGVLSIAAAGNDGNTRTSYPAGYASVVSVAAVDSAKTVADFSQKNADVEIAAPGVSVLSTTPFKVSTLSQGSNNSWIGANIDGSARTRASGALVNGGLCTSAGEWTGKVVLCQRGTNSFAEKVAAVKAGGGIGAAIYNNAPGGFSGTLNGSSTIPAISMSQEDGQAIVAGFLGNTTALDNFAGVAGTAYNGYEYYDGTSMATPHVSGVAALIWSLHPTRTNAQVREALQKTAEDRGTAGRDNAYGFGIVRAKNALEYLAAMTSTPAPITLSVAKVKISGQSYARLTWSGATGDSVVCYRNTTSISTPNDGTHDDGPFARGTSNTYKVCDTEVPATCSTPVTIKF